MVLMDFSIYLESFGHERIGNFKNCIGMYLNILGTYLLDGIKIIKIKEKAINQIKAHNIKELIRTRRWTMIHF
jgi:hypothetical protein